MTDECPHCGAAVRQFTTEQAVDDTPLFGEHVITNRCHRCGRRIDRDV